MKISFSLSPDGLALIEFTPENAVDSAVLAIALKQQGVLPEPGEMKKVVSVSFDARPFFGNMPYIQCEFKGAQEGRESKKTEIGKDTQPEASEANDGPDTMPAGQNTAGGR